MKKKCKDPNCLACKWWPKIVKVLGKSGGCYWIDETSGEVMIATGLRALPNASLVPIEEDECPQFYESECDCGERVVVRSDLMERGLTTRCPQCASMLAQTLRN